MTGELNLAIERVAKAMYEDNYEDGWAAALPQMREHYVDLATIATRVAILALREPTKAMCDAVHNSPVGHNSQDFEDWWRLAIDEAAR